MVAPGKEVVILDDNCVPCPIQWLAARYARKHIVTTQSAPDTKAMSAASLNFTRRAGWRWYFQNQGAGTMTRYVRTKKTPEPTMTFNNEVLPMELKA